ncbi:MAG: WG repeat-containing protein [Planctomycetota bacterium]|nr:WG repeat-containing protein [Planctomycetota bacterium]
MEPSGRIALYPDYRSVRPSGEHGHLVQYRGYGLLEPDGSFAVRPIFDEVASFDGRLAVVRTGSTWGLVDNTGRFIIEPQYHNVLDFREGLSPCLASNGRWGFVNDDGEVAMEPALWEALPFSGPFAPARVRNGWGVIDRDFRFVEPARNRRVVSFPSGICLFFNGRSVRAMNREQKTVERDIPEPLVRNTWRIRNSSDMTRSGAISLPEELFANGPVPVSAGEQTYFLDREGRVASFGPFVDARAFSDSLALVKKDGLYGYIRPDGSWAIEPAFEDARPFSEERAAVKFDGDKFMCYIDTSGKRVTLAVFEEAGRFSQRQGRDSRTRIHRRHRCHGTARVRAARRYSALRALTRNVPRLPQWELPVSELRG